MSSDGAGSDSGFGSNGHEAGGASFSARAPASGSRSSVTTASATNGTTGRGATLSIGTNRGSGSASSNR